MLPAAQSTEGALISSFLAQMDRRDMTATEKLVNLLCFLNTDTSAKLLICLTFLEMTMGGLDD